MPQSNGAFTLPHVVSHWWMLSDCQWMSYSSESNQPSCLTVTLSHIWSYCKQMKPMWHTLTQGGSLLSTSVRVSLQLPSYDESTLRRGGGKNELFKCWQPSHLLSILLPIVYLLTLPPILPCHLATLAPWQPYHLLSSFSLIGGSSVLRHDKGPRWWWERFIISIIIEVNWGLTQSKVD